MAAPFLACYPCPSSSSKKVPVWLFAKPSGEGETLIIKYILGVKSLSMSLFLYSRTLCACEINVDYMCITYVSCNVNIPLHSYESFITNVNGVKGKPMKT